MSIRTSVQNPKSGTEKGYPRRYTDGTTKTAPRRCVNTVNPRGLADDRSRLMSHSSTITRRNGIAQMGGSA
jgi:hypothetical protein